MIRQRSTNPFTAEQNGQAPTCFPLLQFVHPTMPQKHRQDWTAWTLNTLLCTFVPSVLWPSSLRTDRPVSLVNCPLFSWASSVFLVCCCCVYFFGSRGLKHGQGVMDESVFRFQSCIACTTRCAHPEVSVCRLPELCHSPTPPWLHVHTWIVA